MKTTLPTIFRLSVLVGLLILCLGQQAQASHVMGSDLTYTCIGPNQYRITLRVFRDCRGISMPNSYSVAYSGCGSSGSVNVSLQSSSDITPLCPGQTSRCSGGNSPNGVEEYIYQGIVTVPPGCSNITFSTSTCCRNNAVTNLTNPGSNDFYIRAQLNNSIAPCNSSPQFASPPTPFTCVNQSVVYQQLATDIDGDSLVYSLTNCQQGGGTNVTYAGGFNGATPLTVPVTLNPVTGEMSFTANTPQVAVICVLVEEYRNGVKIGEIVRDMQFVIQNCSNQLPALSGINGSGSVFDTATCAGSTICFDIVANDADPANNLTMTYLGNLPGATFTQTGSGNNLVGTFCWTPGPNDVGSFVFSVVVSDDACPIPGQNSRAYTVNILPNPNPPVNAGPDVTICAGESALLTATTAAVNVAGYQWSPATGLSTTVGPTTTATPPATTNYTVTLLYTDGCSSTDDVQVIIAPNPVANVTPATASVCSGASFGLFGNTTASGMIFEWFDPAMVSLGTGIVSGTSTTIAITVPALPGIYTYTLRVTNPITGCFSEDVAVLEVGAPPQG